MVELGTYYKHLLSKFEMRNKIETSIPIVIISSDPDSSLFSLTHIKHD